MLYFDEFGIPFRSLSIVILAWWWWPLQMRRLPVAVGDSSGEPGGSAVACPGSTYGGSPCGASVTTSLSRCDGRHGGSAQSFLTELTT